MGRSRGGFSTKIHAIVDGKGRPLHLELTPGQKHEASVAETLLEHAQGKAFIADTGYDSERIRAAVKARQMKAVIPSHPTRKVKRRYNKVLKPLSRKLRSQMTDAETTLWSKLRRKQLQNLQFYRQKPLGRFIVDFYCPTARLVIEIDGGQHYTKEGVDLDTNRDAELNEMGLHVLRFSNRDVLGKMEGVIVQIAEHLDSKPGR